MVYETYLDVIINEIKSCMHCRHNEKENFLGFNSTRCDLSGESTTFYVLHPDCPLRINSGGKDVNNK